ncbi:nicotinate-nucleotide pyrophosphorylase [Caldalkalibacillus thermarum TA2.A1]|uniref:Probable nicotinate-nucleotide pyrophosphorylase [carboxylating] n=1 Tax=Caldalkalibacillus thermarum (strain TA2.A1) TaxID=986075 RepID=F5L589_CALTT|nr:carboxylating nicotinate-nucleotide diphosphorylase [Caldalkalibacillus thermarum]EGL83487.1 nicotinate-nucleotide pyrophosphorylase [Caldalkalibacillus thermarum TA2.A1]QZT34384.1 carboxylating nicotinate-nucleotide diphosphorylase [Caldalkalibacillus thermarum TA2.A1]
MNVLLLQEQLKQALIEDVGFGDRTTEAVVPAEQWVSGMVVAKEEGIMAGLSVFEQVMKLVDPRVEIEPVVKEGQCVKPGLPLLRVHGPARAILTGERVALNYVQRLSGIATQTRRAVDIVKPYGVKIADTRKTTPGLRMLEKYAVAVGGGINHRLRLDDAVLIKDNHIQAAGGIREAVRRVREKMGHTVFIEVETETLEQVQEAVALGVHGILLDNMTVAQLKEAVALIPPSIVSEASGNMRLEHLEEVAQTGVQVISIGWLTHSAPALDISLNLDGSVKKMKGETP